MEGNKIVNGVGSIYYEKKPTAYSYGLWSSAYQPQFEITGVGSGSNVNAYLVSAGSSQLWPVSQWGVSLQRIPIRIEAYGGWDVVVLDQPKPQSTMDQIVTTKDKLEQIRDIFGLSISQLAKVLLASRPSLHAWLRGEPTRDAHIERINQIYRIAMEWKRQLPYHYAPGHLMRQPLGDGASMLVRFERDQLNDAEIQNGLGKLLRLMQVQREQMDRAKRRSTKAALSIDEQDNTRRGLTTTLNSKE